MTDMDRSVVIELIKEAMWQDDIGTFQSELSGREVFAQVESVTRAEFFEGGRSGLNPEFKFTMLAYDYDGEAVVKYNGLFYSVYRTFMPRTDIIELYVERKGGTNGYVL